MKLTFEIITITMQRVSDNLDDTRYRREKIEYTVKLYCYDTDEYMSITADSIESAMVQAYNDIGSNLRNRI